MLVEPIQGPESAMAKVAFIGIAIKSPLVGRVGDETSRRFLRTFDPVRNRNLGYYLELMDSVRDLVAIDTVAARFNVHRNGGRSIEHVVAEWALEGFSSVSRGSVMLR